MCPNYAETMRSRKGKENAQLSVVEDNCAPGPSNAVAGASTATHSTAPRVAHVVDAPHGAHAVDAPRIRTVLDTLFEPSAIRRTVLLPGQGTCQ